LGTANVSPQSRMHIQQALIPKLRSLREPMIAYRCVGDIDAAEPARLPRVHAFGPRELSARGGRRLRSSSFARAHSWDCRIGATEGIPGRKAPLVQDHRPMGREPTGTDLSMSSASSMGPG